MLGGTFPSLLQINIIYIMPLCLVLASCGISGTTSTTNLLSSEIDTDNSYIETPSQKGQADGASSIEVRVVLKQKTGLPHIRFQPAMSLLGEGINTADCSSTDEHGEARCLLKSNTTDTKALTLSNLPLTKIGAVIFESVTSDMSTSITTAPANGQAPAVAVTRKASYRSRLEAL